MTCCKATNGERTGPLPLAALAALALPTPINDADPLTNPQMPGLDALTADDYRALSATEQRALREQLDGRWLDGVPDSPSEEFRENITARGEISLAQQLSLVSTLLLGLQALQRAGTPPGAIEGLRKALLAERTAEWAHLQQELSNALAQVRASNRAVRRFVVDIGPPPVAPRLPAPPVRGQYRTEQSWQDACQGHLRNRERYRREVHLYEQQLDAYRNTEIVLPPPLLARFP